MASWLDDVLGPTPAPRTVSMTRTGGAPTPPSGGAALPPGYDIATLLKNLEAANTSANSDSMAQYNSLLSTVGDAKNTVLGAGGLYDQAGALQSGMGTTQNAAINSAETKAKATSDQDLIDRGLGNTTVRATNQRGIASDATAARSSVAEQVAGAKSNLLTQKAGATSQFAGMQGDAILSRTNTPPNANLYAQLIQQLMANGGGGGTGGRSYAPSQQPFTAPSQIY